MKNLMIPFRSLCACALIGVAFGSPITVQNIVFESPMTMVNRSQAEEVRKRIREGREPQASAYRALLKDANAALSFTSKPPKELNIMGGYQKGTNLGEIRALMDRESDAAYSTALAWLYSGEAKYADQSSQILRAWTKQGTKLGGHDAGLQIGSYLHRMLYAADILKNHQGWTAGDRKAFEAWWRGQALPHTLQVMRTRDNNWQDAGLLGVLSAAIVFEDKKLLQEGLEVLDDYFGARKGNVNWKFRNDAKGVYIPKEVTRNDKGEGRGITYTAYALTTMVQAMQIAHHCGYDWWQRKAENGATMKGLIECYYRWNELGETFPWHKSPTRRGPHEFRKNPYEFANNHYPGEIQGLAGFLKQNRPVDGRQGDPYITLNHGDMTKKQP
jgi:hypothetical protein